MKIAKKVYMPRITWIGGVPYARMPSKDPSWDSRLANSKADYTDLLFKALNYCYKERGFAGQAIRSQDLMI